MGIFLHLILYLFGFANITAVISALGTPGLSAAGISSGLSTLGGVVGVGMVGGVAVAGAKPIAVGGLGYLAVIGTKKYCQKILEIHRLMVDLKKSNPFKTTDTEIERDLISKQAKESLAAKKGLA